MVFHYNECLVTIIKVIFRFNFLGDDLDHEVQTVASVWQPPKIVNLMEHIIEKEFTIGRSNGNDFEFPMQQVSGRHAIIKCLSENTFIVEDLHSSNGTFLNGYRVKRANCNRNDQLFIADQPFDFAIYFPLKNIKKEIREKFNLPPDIQIDAAAKKSPNDFTAEFAELDAVYKLYNEAKLNLQGKGMLKGHLLKAAPGIVIMLVLTSLGLGVFSFIGGSVGSMVGILMTKSTTSQEKMLAIDDEFKVCYVCPKCKNFLGALPWLGLAAKKCCDRCKAIWVN